MEKAAFVPQWLFNLGQTWFSAEETVSAFLEQLFRSSEVCHEVPLNLLGKTWTKKLDLSAMTWGEIRLRRNAVAGNPYPAQTNFQFWSGVGWTDYNDFDNQHLNDCVTFSRSKTTLFPQGHSVAVDFLLNQQVCKISGKCVPVRQAGGIQLWGSSPELSDVELPDHKTLPQEFRCPITCLPMTVPVVACDGHTYEKNAIEKWMRQSQKSPVTNQELPSQCLVLNHNLRKLMIQWKEKKSLRKNTKTTVELSSGEPSKAHIGA